jgi:hypothetical protein
MSVRPMISLYTTRKRKTYQQVMMDDDEVLVRQTVFGRVKEGLFEIRNPSLATPHSIIVKLDNRSSTDNTLVFHSNISFMNHEPLYCYKHHALHVTLQCEHGPFHVDSYIWFLIEDDFTPAITYTVNKTA